MKELTGEQLALVKQISAEITAELEVARKEAKDEGRDLETDKLNPISDEKLQKMIAAKLEAMGTPVNGNNKRHNSEFNVEGGNDDDRDRDLAPHQPAVVKAIREKAMLAGDSELRRRYKQSTVDEIKEIQRANDDLHILGSILSLSHGVSYADAVRSTKSYRDLNSRIQRDPELRKALAVATSGSGAEWIPTGFSNQLVEELRLERKVVGIFDQFQMPTNPWTLPIQGSKAVAYYVDESTADESLNLPTTTPGTTNNTLTARKLAARVVFSEEVNEDSIISVMDFTRQELVDAFRDAEEKAVLNGDRTATHQDSNVTAANDAQKAFYGLRYYALNNAGTAKVSFSDAVPSTALLTSVRALMGKFGVNPSDLRWIFSVQGYLKALLIAEVVTADKMPNNFTTRTGTLEAFQGIPMIVSEHVYDNLNASGVYDGVTTDQTVVHLVNRKGFRVGMRGQLSVQAVPNPNTDQIILIGKERMAFDHTWDAALAAYPTSVIGYSVKRD